MTDRPRILKNTRMASCKDADDEVWDFVQDEQGITLTMFKFKGTQEKKRDVSNFPAPGIRNGSYLAAIKGSEHSPARLYYQDTDGRIREMLESYNEWTPSPAELPMALPGSGLAAVCWNELNEIRLFYQGDGKRVMEHKFTEGIGWRAGDTIADPQCLTALSAVWGGPFFRVMFHDFYMYYPFYVQNTDGKWDSKAYQVWYGATDGKISNPNAMAVIKHVNKDFGTLSFNCVSFWQDARNGRVYYKGTDSGNIKNLWDPIRYDVPIDGAMSAVQVDSRCRFAWLDDNQALHHLFV